MRYQWSGSDRRMRTIRLGPSLPLRYVLETSYGKRLPTWVDPWSTLCMTDTVCPDTIPGEHDWLSFDRPACTHLGDLITTTTPATTGQVCNWCGEVKYAV